MIDLKKTCAMLILSTGILIAIDTQANPVVIAHRGASGYLPEHTLAAKAMAHAMGVDYIEQDVVLTKDDVPVVLHDIHIDTISDVQAKFPGRKRKDGRYYAIDFTLNELRSLSLTERFNFKTGEPYFPTRFPARKSNFNIATLAEEIELIQGLNSSTGREVGIYVEIKHPEFHQRQGKKIADIVLSTLKKYGYEDKPYHKGRARIYIQCFYPPTLKALKKQTRIPLIQLIADNSWAESSTDYKALMTTEGMANIATYAVGIGPWIKQIVSEKAHATPLMSLAKKNGLTVHAYTARADALPAGVKSFDALHQVLFKAVKIDGLFTDHPDRTVAWLRKNNKPAP